MGYMGFGMQKWIRERKPGKPFSRGESPGFDTLPGRNSSEFRLCDVPSGKTEAIDERIRRDRLRLAKNLRANRIRSTAFTLVILAILAALIIGMSGR